jgi:hypothetical protein
MKNSREKPSKPSWPTHFQSGHEGRPWRPTPFRQMGVPKAKNLHFPRAPDPLAPFLLAGGGGCRAQRTLEESAFLAFRQSLRLAERPVFRAISCSFVD